MPNSRYRLASLITPPRSLLTNTHWRGAFVVVCSAFVCPASLLLLIARDRARAALGSGAPLPRWRARGNPTPKNAWPGPRIGAPQIYCGFDGYGPARCVGANDGENFQRLPAHPPGNEKVTAHTPSPPHTYRGSFSAGCASTPQRTATKEPHEKRSTRPHTLLTVLRVEKPQGLTTTCQRRKVSLLSFLYCLGVPNQPGTPFSLCSADGDGASPKNRNPKRGEAEQRLGSEAGVGRELTRCPANQRRTQLPHNATVL